MKIQLLLLSLIGFATLSSPAQDVYTDNVVIVVDASGSMAEQMGNSSMIKLDAAKAAIKEVLRGIPAETQIGLLVFSSAPSQGWVYPLSPRNDASLYPAIDGLQYGGGTPLGHFMKLGADELLKAREKQYGYGSYRLLIVTDGEASDTQLVDRYTPDIISRGITMDVIGVDMKSAHTLARKVHSYRAADDPESLTRAIQQVFAEVGRSDGTGVAEDAFEELAALPDALAPVILAGLAQSGNKPIGRSPRPKQQPSQPVSSFPSSSTSSTPLQVQSSTRGPSPLFFMAILAVPVIMILNKLTRG